MANASGPQESDNLEIMDALRALSSARVWLKESREQLDTAERQIAGDLEYVNNAKIELYRLGWKG